MGEGKVRENERDGGKSPWIWSRHACIKRQRHGHSREMDKIEELDNPRDVYRDMGVEKAQGGEGLLTIMAGFCGDSDPNSFCLGHNINNYCIVKGFTAEIQRFLWDSVAFSGSICWGMMARLAKMIKNILVFRVVVVGYCNIKRSVG